MKIQVRGYEKQVFWDKKAESYQLFLMVEGSQKFFLKLYVDKEVLKLVYDSDYLAMKYSEEFDMDDLQEEAIHASINEPRVPHELKSLLGDYLVSQYE